MKFYQSVEFRLLQSQWREKLKDSGFEDIEKPAVLQRFSLKRHDNRTCAFWNADRIVGFFLSLDRLMTHYPEMPPFEREVLVLYSQGVFIKRIVKQLKCSERNVYYVIKRYKGLIKAIERMSSETIADCPSPLEAQKEQSAQGLSVEKSQFPNKGSAPG